MDVVGKGTPIAEGDFSGTPEAPKVYIGNVTVEISNVASMHNAVVKGNLTITGAKSGTFSLENLTVEGNLDLSGLDASVNFNNIKIAGETIF